MRLPGKKLPGDLMPNQQSTKGTVAEKIGKLVVMNEADVLFANAKHAVDDANGETQLSRVKAHFAMEGPRFTCGPSEL
jgi:hypothetical protein